MLRKIQELSTAKQSSKSAIARYLLEHLAEVEHLSLEDIATESFTSKASVVRFAKSLGYKGWSDFLPALLSARYYSDTHYSDVDHSLPFTQEDDIATIIQKIATIQKESIQDTADQLSDTDLEEAADLIKKARRVVIYGLSPNNYLAELFKRKMLTIGKHVEVVRTNEFGLTSASLDENDLAIIISYSGNSLGIESLRNLPLLQKNKVKIIGITSENGMLLRNASDRVFQICTREDKVKKIGNFSTEESILFILNALYAAYFRKDFTRNYVKKISLAKDLESNR